MYFLKGTRHADALVKLRGVKDFDTLPSTLECVKIEGRQSYYHPTWIVAPYSVRDLYHLMYFYDYK
jgi:hypothetical protein